VWPKCRFFFFLIFGHVTQVLLPLCYRRVSYDITTNCYLRRTVRKPKITVLTTAIIYFDVFWYVTPFNGISSKKSIWNILPHYRASNNLQHSIKLLYRTPLTPTFSSTYKGGGRLNSRSAWLLADGTCHVTLVYVRLEDRWQSPPPRQRPKVAF